MNQFVFIGKTRSVLDRQPSAEVEFRMTFRQRISLDGTWNFQWDATNQRSAKEIQEIASWRQAQVPMPWQAQFDDLHYASGVAWYRRIIQIDERLAESAILHFDAVDYHAAVWVNGEKAGEHEGGYLPFEFDVTHLLHNGENEILVRAMDPAEDSVTGAEFPFREIPHGKQSWYGPIGGIWQSVWLEWRPAVHFLGLRLTPHPDTGLLDIATPLSFTLANNTEIHVRVFDPNGREITQTQLNAGGAGSATLDTASLQLWSPDGPALYRVTATLNLDGRAVDEISATCGFRTISARDGRIYLNGQPIYLRGVLDQAYYPETIYTPPSLAFLEDQVRKAKALGLNCLRCHIKIEDPRYYEVADRLGILVWTEIPNWALLTEASSRRGKETFYQMVERDWNHPSIFAWTLINENWGTDLTRNAEHRAWLADFYHEAKKIDPYRLIVDNSACRPNFHVAGDLEDYHDYRAIPDHAEKWDQWVADFANRADWAWAQDYAHERRADLPLIVSEFGNWGLPHPDRIQEHGRDPWWFETGHEWGPEGAPGIVYPHGIRERFEFWQLDQVFGSFDQFIEASQTHMARSLAYEITTMRLHQAIGGYVITEFTDVHWECNGLLDMQRHVKHGLDAIFTPINQDKVLAIRPQRWSGRPGELAPVAFHTCDVDGLSPGAAALGENSVIHWQAKSGTATIEGKLAAPGGVVQIPLSAPGMVTLHAQWRTADGAVLASNHVELACIAPRTFNGMPEVTVSVIDDDALAGALRALGCVVTRDASAAGSRTIIVAHHFTNDLQAAVQQGARLLLLAGPDFNKVENATRLPSGAVIARAGSPWQGDWATSFSWLKKQGPFADLPGGPFLEMEYADVAADAVIAGIPAWAYREHSWAGLALGWIHKPVSLLAKTHYGRGAVTTTTFNVTPSLLANSAVAQAIMGGLLALA
jgi:hypothetical protein